MRLTVVYYGGLKQDVGAKRETLDLPHATLTVRELSELLRERHPSLASRLHTVAVAVNDALVESDYVLQDGDEASLLPPVSGG